MLSIKKFHVDLVDPTNQTAKYPAAQIPQFVMFARIINSAKSFIKPLQPNSAAPQAQVEPATMVTTRQQESKSLSKETNTKEETVPTPTSKRKSEKITRDKLAASDSPSGKKRKALPVRAKDETPITPNTRVVVEIPTKRLSPEPEAETADPGKQSGSAKKHKKFGSEEPEEALSSTAPEQHEPAVEEIEDSEESSDDDAPEEVGAQDAARDAKSKTQNAEEAVKA